MPSGVKASASCIMHAEVSVEMVVMISCMLVGEASIMHARRRGEHHACLTVSWLVWAAVN